MQARTEAQVEGWDSQPFPGGYAALRELADAEFSGAVVAGRTWLFMLNGRIVGIFEGSLDDFDDQNGTVYSAPDPALPLLFSMQERGGETQAKYYTNKTSLSEANGTLSDANFTGYVELSENVLSGDYYVVYYGGRSMSAAFIGESQRLLTGDEAFERADDEVGIYEVKNVDVEVIDLPGSEPSESTEAAGAGTSGESDRNVQSEESSGSSEQSSGASPEQSPEPTPEPAVEKSADPSGSPPAEQSEPTVDSSPESSQASSPDTQADRNQASQRPPIEEAEPRSKTSEQQTPTEDSRARQSTPTREERPDERETEPEPEPRPSEPSEETGNSRFNEEEQWREANAIPALDPERTTAAQRATGQSSGHGRQRQQSNQQRDRQSPQQSDHQRGRQSRQKPNQQQHRTRREERSQTQQNGGTTTAEASDLQSSLEETKAENERLREQLAEARSSQSQADDEREKLRSKVEQLETHLQEAKAATTEPPGGSAAESGERLSPSAALDGTNLFVRYNSKGQATLEDARRNGAERDEVDANLRLEHHTQFDADEATVDGQPFDAFLDGRIEFQFVRWLVRDFLYEIRDTGHEGGLREIYDAIPNVDRAELNGSITIEETEEREGGDHEFDVVLRDRMGNPLLVANLNDSRDPATSEMMKSLVDASTAIVDVDDGLGGAFLVTASFFEPAALETASEATSGGLLSREKRESFVKRDRKRGYHLCLVETRAGEFHVNVPEL